MRERVVELSLSSQTLTGAFCLPINRPYRLPSWFRERMVSADRVRRHHFLVVELSSFLQDILT